ncbi:MAG: OsmC family protein [Rhodocyclaceae bacterium]|jgi:organic hydroperoxide reductase OsmC/OhrA|nr:OsmC family protein [Rhodocyclaceae bacterium]
MDQNRNNMESLIVSDMEPFTFTLEQQDDYAFLIRFDTPDAAPLLSDEPAPLGRGAGPNPSRLLAAAVANCLSASLLFALRKFKNRPEPIRASVTTRLGRNAAKRLRVEGMEVDIQLGRPGTEMEHLERVLAQFEDFCVVTQSVRQGFEVNVRVRDGEGRLLAG